MSEYCYGYSGFLKGVPKPKSLSGVGLSDAARAQAQVGTAGTSPCFTNCEHRVSTCIPMHVFSVPLPAFGDLELG